MFNDFQRPTWAEINLENLAHNFKKIKEKIGSEVKMMAVVKADGYGHNALKCAKRLEKEGIDWFGVALPEEGIELRKNGIRKQILCLGSFWPGQEKQILNHNLTPVVFRREIAEKLNEAAKERGVVADVHLKVDTGMNRIGIRFDELSEFADNLRDLKNLSVAGLMTHFASADNDEEFTNLQIKRFNESLKLLREKGFRPIYQDMANSPATVAFPNSRGNMVRIGGILYGLTWDVLPKNLPFPELRPVMSLKTKITVLKRVPKGESIGYSRLFQTSKDSLIATIPIGYQDGYLRGLSNQANVIVNGVYAKVAGRVSMDWTTIDVTDVPNVKLGDEVILFGSDGENSVAVEELAKFCNTISYEVTCGISRRVPRYFIEKND